MCTAQGFAFLGAALVSYLITLLDGASHRIGSGDRCWPWLQKLDVWRRISLFLFGPQSILCSESDTKAVESCVQAIVAAHPHGIMSWNHTMMFTNCAGYMDRFPNLCGERRRDLGASVVFMIPFFRDLLLWTGGVDAGKATARQVLKSGRSMFVYPGGEKEQLLTTEHQHKCYVNSRKGFCRLAVEYGIPVIPHYTFGETSMYGVSKVLFRARMWLCDVLHVAIPVAWGRYGIPFPLGLPRKPPQGMNLCVGAPIIASNVDPKDKAAFAAAVDDLHGRYLVALRTLFDQNKEQCGYPHAEIELLPEAKEK